MFSPKLSTRLASMAAASAVLLAPAISFAQDATAAAAATPVPDKGDTTWMLVATVLVMMMTVPGSASSMAVSFAPKTFSPFSCRFWPALRWLGSCGLSTGTAWPLLARQMKPAQPHYHHLLERCPKRCSLAFHLLVLSRHSRKVS